MGVIQTWEDFMQKLERDRQGVDEPTTLLISRVRDLTRLFMGQREQYRNALLHLSRMHEEMGAMEISREERELAELITRDLEAEKLKW